MARQPVWGRYLQFPEVLELGRDLGCNMETDYVEKQITKYQRPPGFLPLGG